MRSAEIFWINPDQQRRIGVFLVSGKQTHPVRDYPPRFRSRSHHFTARTHTKRISRTSVRQMDRQFIISGSQLCPSGITAVLRRINHRLQMLNPRSDGKRLAFHHNSDLIKHFKGISRTVPYCQNQFFRRLFVNRTVCPADLDSPQPVFLNCQPA